MRPGKNRLKRLDDVSKSVGIIENTAHLPIERVFSKAIPGLSSKTAL